MARIVRSSHAFCNLFKSVTSIGKDLQLGTHSEKFVLKKVLPRMSNVTNLPHILLWYPQSEDKHLGVPRRCQTMLAEKFRIVWAKDVFENQDLRNEIQVALGFQGALSLKTVEDHLESFPRLKVVAVLAAGYDGIDLKPYRDRGIRVCNNDGFTEATAEHALMLVLATARNIIKEIEECKNGAQCVFSWNNPAPGLSGATLGIIGLGKIGTVLARAARVLSAGIIYNKRTPRSTERDNEDEYEYVTLETLLQQSDYIVLTCPLTSETRSLIGWEQLKMMKSSAALINIARAEVIDQEALVQAIKDGEIRAAALDVTSPPILPTDHPLLNMPNVIVTNHCAYCTEKSLVKAFEIAMFNAVEGLSGRPMPNEIV